MFGSGVSLFLSLGWSCIVSRYMPCIVLERRIGFAVPLGTPAAAFSTLNAATCHAITKSFHIAFSAQKCFASVTFRNFKYCLRYSVFSIREEADYNTAISFSREEYLGLHREAVGLANAMRRIIDQADNLDNLSSNA